MTLEELKEEIKGLGFSDDETMDEYVSADIIVTAINRAINLVCSTVIPLTKKYEIIVEEDGYKVYDMKELVTDFLDFDGKPKIFLNGEYKWYNDFFYEEQTKVLLRAEKGNQITIYYKAKPEPITKFTENEHVIEVHELVTPLLPMLASYFIWLDDEPTKASSYYNIYDDMKNQILSARTVQQPTKIIGGIKWGR